MRMTLQLLSCWLNTLPWWKSLLHKIYRHFQNDGKCLMHCMNKAWIFVICIVLAIIKFSPTHISWPPVSPDLPVCDFFMWSHLKSKVYCSQPTTIEELRSKIQEKNTMVPVKCWTMQIEPLSLRACRMCVQKWSSPARCHLQEINLAYASLKFWQEIGLFCTILVP